MSCQPRPVPCQLTESVVVSEVAVNVMGVSLSGHERDWSLVLPEAACRLAGDRTPLTSRATAAPGSVTTLMS